MFQGQRNESFRPCVSSLKILEEDLALLKIELQVTSPDLLEKDGKGLLTPI